MGNSGNAIDFIDWNYLCSIAELIERPRNLTEATRLFAYDFTSTPSEENQNTMLREWLERATYLQSPATTEEVVAALAYALRCPLEPLREFAKANGIRLKRA